MATYIVRTDKDVILELRIDDGQYLNVYQNEWPFTVRVATASNRPLTVFKALSITEIGFLDKNFALVEEIDDVPEEPDEVKESFNVISD